MFMRHYIPAPPLNDFVGLFWLYEGYRQAHALERCLPTGTTELVINLRDDRVRIYDRQDVRGFQTLPGVLVCGPHSEFFVIDTEEQFAVMGVHFKPGGAFPFFKLPAGEVRNQHVALADLWGAHAGELRERLLAAPTPAAKFHVLETILLDQLARPLARHPAVNFALRHLPRARSLGDLTNQIGLSQRRFIQLFDAQVGLTPKLYARVQRFQQVLRLTQRQTEVDWAEVALQCGYFDQAHFSHDFKAFSGLNPTTYLTLRGTNLNHVQLPD
jgi:AraC-like DNA-binding protein